MHVDLVIVDITHPEPHGGAEFAQRLHLSGIPSLVVADRPDLGPEGVPVLEKPVRLTALLETIEELLQNAQADRKGGGRAPVKAPPSSGGRG
jgi:hypothetical protein